MNEHFSFAEISSALRQDDGTLYWLVRRGGVVAGSRAGYLDGAGYLSVGYRGKILLAHRVVWLLETGEWPSARLDNINRKRTDNRPVNLRPSTNQQNSWNRSVRDGATFKGISFHRQTGKHQARICKDGQITHLGLFDTPEQAAAAYDSAARHIAGAFANLNFKG